jgi:hypothetical protein
MYLFGWAQWRREVHCPNIERGEALLWTLRLGPQRRSGPEQHQQEGSTLSLFPSKKPAATT